MKPLLLILCFNCLTSFTQDTLDIKDNPIDTLKKHEFSGVVLETPTGLLAYDPFELYTLNTPKFYYHNIEKGKVEYVDEIQFFKDTSGAITSHHFYSKFYDKNEPDTFVETQYYGVNQLRQITTTKDSLKRKTSKFIFYDKNGRTQRTGQYFNGREFGAISSYNYNDTILFTEIWTNGFLTDVQRDRVLFVGEKNKIISRKEYFEIIKSQGGIQWEVLVIPASKLDNPYNIAFIMHSGLLDLMKLHDKHWEDDKYVDIIMKRYKKYLSKTARKAR